MSGVGECGIHPASSGAGFLLDVYTTRRIKSNSVPETSYTLLEFHLDGVDLHIGTGAGSDDEPVTSASDSPTESTLPGKRRLAGIMIVLAVAVLVRSLVSEDSLEAAEKLDALV